MKLGKTISGVAVLFGVAASLAAPANAAPSPGDRCSVNDFTSPDGTLTCSHQAGIWMHLGMPMVQPGDPCDRKGDVTYTPPEDLVFCRSTPKGLFWLKVAQ